MLPNKPSKLINLALNDLERVEKDDRYIVDMEDWHVPEENGQCFVCLAGAVMAKTLGAPIDELTCPLYTSHEKELEALDNFRCGWIETALRGLGLHADIPRFKSRVEVRAYSDNPKQFKDDMRDMARQFERAGL